MSGTHSASAAEEEGRTSAWSSLASWLRNGRLERGLSIADIARTTKIQARILEDLEAGATEGLPADVFVRGFVRNYARCVGLSEAEALARYSACSRDAGPVATPAATAVAEMYAPTSRRISTVVPVAPGSPAAEVHAQSHLPSSSYARPGYTRAATSPGSGLSSSPRVLRAPTENGEDLAALAEQGREVRRTSGQMAAVVPAPLPVSTPASSATSSLQSSVSPAVIYPRPAVGSGVVSTAGVAAAVEAEVARAIVTPVITPAVVAPVAVEPVAVAPAAVAPAWPSSNAKKRKQQKRKEREERQARRNPRAQTVRPMLESDLYEIEPAIAAAAAATAQMEAAKAAASQVVATVEVAPVSAIIEAPVHAPVVAAEGWPSVGAGAGHQDVAVAAAVSAAEAAPLAEAAESPVAVAPVSEVWIPRMPPAPRPSRSFVAPTLTIDDSDPESASQLQDDRNSDRDGREPTRRTFLPPILLESQDRANRQGGLTLAVIILLIAATLTLSYLMRRPSTGGAGMTRIELPIEAPAEVDAPSMGRAEHLG